MIKVFTNIFDKFVIAARILPALTACFPFLFMIFYNGAVKSKWVEAGIGLVLFVVVVSFLSFVVREFGKKYEEKFYCGLGGKPTTIIMRFTDQTIDVITKVEYHKWLNNKLPDLLLPLSKSDEIQDMQSDYKYESAVNYLRTYVNAHREQHPRVYQELIKYNYWRNLYGSKWCALTIYLIAIIREIFVIDHFSIKELFISPFPKYILFIVLLVWSLLFCLVVTKKVVKRNAFDYAKTLLETINELSFGEN